MSRINEQSQTIQERMIRDLLQTPHRQVDSLIKSHKECLDQDPDFYGKLACYAVLHNGTVVRDHQDVFISTLFISPYPEHRDAAWVMSQELPPHRLVRVLNYITGCTDRVYHKSFEPAIASGLKTVNAKYSKNYHNKSLAGKPIPPKDVKLSRAMAKDIKCPQNFTITAFDVTYDYHNKSLNRIAKSAVKHYLRFREQPTAKSMLYGALIRYRKSLKRLYSVCHIAPSKWVDRVLFKEEALEDSPFVLMKKIKNMKDPAAKAELIINHKIPYAIAVSLLDTITPTITIALINAMSPQELLSNLSSIEKSGAYQNKDVKSLVFDKLKSIKKKNLRADALKGVTVLQNLNTTDEELKGLVSDVVDEKIKSHGNISLSTALLVDTSSSMTEAIEFGKIVASAIAQATTSAFKMYLFGDVPRRIDWETNDGDPAKKSNWDKKLKMVKAAGSTDLGACIKLMIRDKAKYEQIVLVTDEEENGAEKFANTFKEYMSKMSVNPNVIILRLGVHASDKIQRDCIKNEIPVDVLDCKKLDLVAVPNLLKLLSKPSVFELIQDILAIKLPKKPQI